MNFPDTANIRSWLVQYFSESVIQSPLFELLLEMQRQMGFDASSSVEISKKIIGKREYLDRLNFLYANRLTERYHTCMKFLDNSERNTGVNLDTAQTLALVMDEDPTNLTQVVTGLDLRPEPGQSRFKVWFEFTNAAKLIERTFKQLGYYQKVKEYIVINELLLGFGFYPDGRSEIKAHLNYGEFRHAIRAKLKLCNLFEKRVFDAFDWSDPLYLCFRGKEPRIFIYFCHTDVEELLGCLKLDEIPREILLLNEQKPDIFGAYYDELLKRSLHEYNLYYQLKMPVLESI